MLKRVLLAGGAVVALIAVCICFGVKVEASRTHRIWIDAARPSEVELPFEVVGIGDNAENGLWLPPGTGRGWKGEGGGKAAYRFHIPTAGKYNVWAYVLWQGVCSNAIYAQFDDGKKSIIGNDSVFKKWHWVRAYSLELREGDHMLRLSNHSDSIAVIGLLLTNSDQFKPSRDDVPITFFFDSFDGCDSGNFAAWEQEQGKWTTHHPQSASKLDQKVLIGPASGEGFMIYNRESWRDCHLSASIRFNNPEDRKALASICFRVKDLKNYFALEIVRAPNSGHAEIRLVRVKDGREKYLQKMEVKWAMDKWHDVRLRVQGSDLGVSLDGGKECEFQIAGNTEGGIALRTSGGAVHFDSIHVSSIVELVKQ